MLAGSLTASLAASLNAFLQRCDNPPLSALDMTLNNLRGKLQ